MALHFRRRLRAIVIEPDNGAMKGRAIGPCTANAARGLNGEILILMREPKDPRDFEDLESFKVCLAGSRKPKILNILDVKKLL